MRWCRPPLTDIFAPDNAQCIAHLDCRLTDFGALARGYRIIIRFRFALLDGLGHIPLGEEIAITSALEADEEIGGR